MPQSFGQLYVHLVFSTKHRFPFLADADLRQETHAYLTGVCKRVGSPSIAVGGIEDHVHLLCFLSRTLSVADLVSALKKASSAWLKGKGEALTSFYWQTGYGAFSVSPAHVKALTAYVLNQEEHHRQESFQDEYRRILRKYGIEFDERYVWD